MGLLGDMWVLSFWVRSDRVDSHYKVTVLSEGKFGYDSLVVLEVSAVSMEVNPEVNIFVCLSSGLE